MKTHLTDENLKDIIGDVDGVPSLPIVANKIIQVINDSKSAAKDLADLISKDHSLAVKVLKMVNSSFYGLKGNITSISHGVVILGFHTIKNLALGLASLDTINTNIGSLLNTEKFWEHSLACAICAKKIAVGANYHTTDEPFIAGLLHDIGELILNQYVPDRYEKAVLLCREEGIPIFEAEDRVIGVTHNIVGEWLLNKWNLPGMLALTTLHHNSPPISDNTLSKEELKLIIIVYMADTLCKQKGYYIWESEIISPIDKCLAEKIDLDPENLETLIGDIDEEIKEIKMFFGV